MQHCGKKTPCCPLSARKFFNWLDILFPDFPRDQIRVTGEITSRIQFTLTCLNLMWEKQRWVVVVVWWCWGIPVSCMSSRALCLIALLLTKCWCNYKKEAYFLFLLMRVTLVSGWTGLMKSRGLILPLLLYFPTHSPSVCFQVSDFVHYASPSVNLHLLSAIWYCHERLVTCLFRCQRSYTGCIYPECEYSWANDLRVWEAIAVSLSLRLE